MRVLIALALVCCFSLAFSQPSSPSGGKSIQQQNAKPSQPTHNPASEQRGTEQQPIFIKSLAGPESESDARHKEYEHHEKPTLERYMGYGTLALAFFTCALFIFTALLWRVTLQLSKDAKTSGESQSMKMGLSIAEAIRAATAMEEVAKATKDNAVLMQGVMHRQMRAYISVDLGEAFYQDANFKFGSKPVFENTGFTPARKVCYWVSADILPSDTPADFSFPVGNSMVTDVGMSPRQKYVVNGVVDKFYPDSEVAEIIKGEKKKLFVWGVVTYEDVFGGTWTTRFCHSFYFYPAEKGLLHRGSYHPGHNHAT